MTDDHDLSAAVRSAYDDAVDYIDTHIAPGRELAQRYYDGQPFGNEEDGRSQIVLTEVRDVVQSMMPSLLRVFTSTERAFEYLPRGREDVDLAEQISDYVASVVLSQDNDAYTLFHSLLKDALLLKSGVAKWWWDERREISEETYTGLSIPSVVVLLQDPELEVLTLEASADVDTSAIPPLLSGLMSGVDGLGISPDVTIDLRVRRTRTVGRVKVAALPPEEFLIDRRARDVETSAYVAHRTLRTVSDLVAMGYDRDEVMEHADDNSDSVGWDMAAYARNSALNMGTGTGPDPAMRTAVYVEHYIRYDSDDDGIAELHRVCSIGDACHILHDEIVTEAPFALFSPDTVPHAAIGNSVADQVMDIQRIKSAILRNTLDSLAQSIHPRTVIIENQVNYEDVLNVEVGGIIRAKSAGAVQPLEMPFVGQFSLPMMSYMDDLRASRTGISKASQGLDADVLQSTTRAAVTATMSAAQERLEMVARTLAETGMKRLARGILRLVVRHQDRPRMTRLRGRIVEIDPRSWDAEMDVSITTALGRGDDASKLGFLAQILAKQELAMQTLGPDNPVAGLREWRHTMARMCEIAGFKDSDRFFKALPEVDQPAGQPKPDQMQTLASIEQAKMDNDYKIAIAKLEVEKLKLRMEDDRLRDIAAADQALKQAAIGARYNAQVDTAALRAEVERDRYAADAIANQPPMPQPMQGPMMGPMMDPMQQPGPQPMMDPASLGSLGDLDPMQAPMPPQMPGGGF